MRSIEAFVAESIILIAWAIGRLVALICVLAVFAAGISLIVRVIYWLKFGYWITSLCDGHLQLLLHKRSLSSHDQAFLCMDANIGWAGVEQLIRWFFLQGDMSLALLLLGLILLGSLIVSALILRFVPKENWLRRYYESR
ncbi:hypothetical protein ACHMW7_21865 [Aminobacter sp. UC22_36]|uniref:hypothetical protein n=1 Tax=Aminobacter sp. UC22_36 TaxID=3374549 RepID=UPI003756FAE0